MEPFNFSFFSFTGWGIDLDYCDTEWFALETNRDHSVVFEIASKYCNSDSFVDHDGYSISSKGFLPTVVDIMVIWVKFSHCFLTSIQVSQEAGRVAWYSHLFKNFPQFVVIHTVKSFSVFNEAEVDVFLELSCFLQDPTNVDNLISGSSAFSKSRLYI